MAASDLYVLPENVKLIPVAEIDGQTRTKFEYEENDFVITYINARQTSKVIDAASAALLKTFITPSTMVEGIFKYSVLNNLNPQDTVEQAYTLLSRFRNEGFLKVFDKDTGATQKDSLQPGDYFNGYLISEKIQGIEDTQVYKVKKDGAGYILKLLKKQVQHKTSPVLQQFENEVDILKKLNNAIAPSLIESGVYKDDRYIIMEFFEGKTSDIFSDQYRNIANTNNLHRLLNVSLHILHAYTHLHQQGVVHGDIHPRNILVSDNGTVRIIDFGLASVSGEKSRLVRGGVSFFFEPEYAACLINNKQPQPASFESEQYAIAVLLYFLLTGRHHINFSYEKDVLLRQIVNEPPAPFSKYDIELDKAIEQVLFKALSKNPEDRYPSTAAFKNAFEAAMHICFEKTGNNKEQQVSADAFCEGIKAKFGLEGSYIDNGLQAAPFASVNYGAAGIAYMFYRMALIESDPELLAVADIWINRAMRFMQDEASAFYAKEIDITKEMVGEISVYHTESGIHLVQSLVCKAQGLKNRFYAVISNFISAANRNCDNPDLTLGKSSILIGAALLLEQITGEDGDIKKELLSLGNAILRDIWNTLDTNNDIANNETISYRGIAHGWAGILYATLRWCKQSNAALPKMFYARTEELIALGIEENNYIRWNITNTNAVSWTGWCHGSAGYTFLWSALYEYTYEGKYMELAKKSANHFLHASTSLNVSLCCGLSGECYALLRLFNITGDDYYLQQVKMKVKKILPNVYAHEARNNSLYKGDIGAAVLLTEMNKPEYARMPLFE